MNGEVITNPMEQRKLKSKHLRGGFPVNNELETESLGAWTTKGRSVGESKSNRIGEFYVENGWTSSPRSPSPR